MAEVQPRFLGHRSLEGESNIVVACGLELTTYTASPECDVVLRGPNDLQEVVWHICGLVTWHNN
jgi:hypothetical protein